MATAALLGSCSGAVVCGQLSRREQTCESRAPVTRCLSASRTSSIFAGSDAAALRSSPAFVPSSREPQSLTVTCGESRIGKKPIPVPKGVTIKLAGQSLSVKGPLGELSREYPPEVKLTEDGGAVLVARANETRRARQMHGLFRTLTANMVDGVNTGFKKNLQLIGVGYRAAVKGQELTMNLGFSHPVVMPIPDGITCKVEANTNMEIKGRDKELVGQFAASVRKWREPEPYKGKGIKYIDEVIRRKQGKAGKKK